MAYVIYNHLITDVNGVDLTNAIGTKSPYPLSKAWLYAQLDRGE